MDLVGQGSTLDEIVAHSDGTVNWVNQGLEILRVHLEISVMVIVLKLYMAMAMRHFMLTWQG